MVLPGYLEDYLLHQTITMSYCIISYGDIPFTASGQWRLADVFDHMVFNSRRQYEYGIWPTG